MSQKNMRNVTVLLAIALMLATVSVTLAAGMTPEQVAAAEREFTYTSADDVAVGRRAAERYWLYTHTIGEIAAAEREFSYTTAEAVQKGKAAAEVYWQSRAETASQ